MWCDQAKWVWSRKFKFFVFWYFLFRYNLSFNLVKPPWKLSNWFSINSILSDCKNNEKQRKLSALFGYIFKLILASSDSFCLIASHLYIFPFINFACLNLSASFIFVELEMNWSYTKVKGHQMSSCKMENSPYLKCWSLIGTKLGLLI